MKYIFKHLIFPLALLIIIIVALFILPSNITESILSSIPIVNQFVKTTAKTRLTGLSEKQMSQIDTARFSVDFLLHIQSGTEHYIALYPFTVSSGFSNDISFEISEEKKELTVIIPEPEITSVTSDSDSVLIIRDTLKKSDWNALINPVQNAFSRKAKDYAIESGILTRSVDNLMSYLNDLYANSDLELKFLTKSTFENSNSQTETIEAKWLPIKFSVQKNTFLHKSEEVLSRDDTYFTFQDTKNFRVGEATLSNWHETQTDWIKNVIDSEYGFYTSKEDFVSALSSTKKQGISNIPPTLLLYRDPFNPKEKIVISDAENLFRTTYILLGDDKGTILFVESQIPNDQVQLDIGAENALYIAFSAIKSDKQKENTIAQQDYKILYDKALKSLKNESYVLVSDYVSKMKQLNESCGFDNYEQDLKSLDSITTLLYMHEQKKSGNDLLDNWVKIANTIHQNDFASMDEDFRKASLIFFDNVPEARLNLKSYFLKHSDAVHLSEYEKNAFIDDLTQNGDIINRDLFVSLDNKSRQRYLEQVFSSKIKQISIETEKNDTFILTGSSFDNLFNKKNKGPTYIRNKIALDDNQNIVYVIFPQKKIFSDSYTAMIFAKDALYLFHNFTSIFAPEKIIVPYEEITTYGDGFFTIQGKSYQDAEIQPILKELQLIYSNDDAYAVQISEDIYTYLKKYIEQIMKRP